MATITLEQHDFVPLEPVSLPIPLQHVHSIVPSHLEQDDPSSFVTAPRATQPVFEAARLAPLRRGQRIAVTVLLLAANIVQVSCNFEFWSIQISNEIKIKHSSGGVFRAAYL